MLRQNSSRRYRAGRVCLKAQNTPIPEEIPTSQLPGGLKGEIILLAKNGNQLNIAVKITNESSRGDAFILLFGEPSTFDDAGGKYGKRAISGVENVVSPVI